MCEIYNKNGYTCKTENCICGTKDIFNDKITCEKNGNELSFVALFVIGIGRSCTDINGCICADDDADSVIKCFNGESCMWVGEERFFIVLMCQKI